MKNVHWEQIIFVRIKENQINPLIYRDKEDKNETKNIL